MVSTPLCLFDRSGASLSVTAPLNEHPEVPASRSESPSAPSESGSRGGLGVAELRDFVRRHLLLLILAPIVAVVVMIVVDRLLPSRYEATVTLLVSQLELESSIEGQPLPVQGFQWILESPPVLRAAEQRIALATDGREVPLEVGANIETEMLLRRREQSALAPIIELAARAESAELAVLMANAWNEAFQEHLGRLREAEFTEVVDKMSEALAEAESLQREAEMARSVNREEFAKRQLRLASGWRESFGKVLKRHEERLASLGVEARGEMDTPRVARGTPREVGSGAPRRARPPPRAHSPCRAGTPEPPGPNPNRGADRIAPGVAERWASL